MSNHVKTLERLAFGIEQHPDELKLRRLLSKDAVAIRALLEENERLRTGGITEVAVVNLNVTHYMEHWEGRAEKAEARLDAALALVEELREDATLNSSDYRAFCKALRGEK